MGPSAQVLEALLDRLGAMRAVGKLKALLKEAKAVAPSGPGTASGPDASPPRVRTTGTVDQLKAQTREVVEANLVNLGQVAALVDELEEHGAQHVFLYRFTDAGREAVRNETFLAAVREGRAVDARTYEPKPSRPELFGYTASDGYVIKKVHSVAYWKQNDKLTKETKSRRTIVYDRATARAVHTLWLNPRTDEAEIRIDRIRPDMDDTLAQSEFDAFCASLKDIIDVATALEPLSLWPNFSSIVNERRGTFMATDFAADPSVNRRVNSRRQAGRGVDIRDHSSFGELDRRDTVNIWWAPSVEDRSDVDSGPESDGEDIDDADDVGAEDDEAPGPKGMVHTIISKTKKSPHPVKIYIARRLDRKTFRDVISRIRGFAACAS